MASLLSRRAYLDGRLSLFCKEREINIEVIEARFNTIICLIFTNLLCLECHVVTLQSAVRSILEAWARYYENKT